MLLGLSPADVRHLRLRRKKVAVQPVLGYKGSGFAFSLAVVGYF